MHDNFSCESATSTKKQPAIMYNFRHLMQLSRVQKSRVVRVILYYNNTCCRQWLSSLKNEKNESRNVSFISLVAFFYHFHEESRLFELKIWDIKNNNVIKCFIACSYQYFPFNCFRRISLILLRTTIAVFILGLLNSKITNQGMLVKNIILLKKRFRIWYF